MPAPVPSTASPVASEPRAHLAALLITLLCSCLPLCAVQAPYFYEVGNQLNHVVQDLELSRFLSTTFKTRYHELVSKGLNITTGEEMLKLASKLSVEEQQLFTGGRTSVNCVNSWWTGEALDASKQASQHPIFSNKRAADTAQQADQDGANKQQRT